MKYVLDACVAAYGKLIDALQGQFPFILSPAGLP